MAKQNKFIKFEKDGFECEINPEILEDIDMLENIAIAEKGDLLASIQVAKNIFGAENYLKLKEFLKEKNGVAKADVVFECVKEIVEKVAETKKK